MIVRTNPSFFDILPGFDVAPLVEVDDDQEIARAVALASRADCAVLVLGEAQNMIGEGASRASFDLPGRQQELLEAVLATGKAVVVVLMAARPLDLKGAQPQAILNIWYPGTQGGTAVANTLFGDAQPGGKLPFNWPRSIGQVPLPYARMVTHKPDDRETRYWDQAGSPLYPFGHGLSYSRFDFSDLSLAKPVVQVGEDVEVSVTLANTGSRTADEVVQVYIHRRYGSAARPVRELKGFRRLTLAAGETRQVAFSVKSADLAYWSSASRSWVNEPGEFDLFVGADSTAQLAARFRVEA